MPYVAGNKDPYSGDTSQQHESHTTTPSVSQFINSYVSATPSYWTMHGWKYSNSDPWTCGTTYNAASGQFQWQAFSSPTALSTSNIIVGVTAAGSGVTAVNFGVYSADGGTQVASATGTPSAFQSTGLVSTALTATLAANTTYYLGIFITFSTANPSLLAAIPASGGGPLFKLGGTRYRVAYLTGQGSLPATFDPTAPSGTVVMQQPWFAFV